MLKYLILLIAKVNVLKLLIWIILILPFFSSYAPILGMHNDIIGHILWAMLYVAATNEKKPPRHSANPTDPADSDNSNDLE